MLQNNKEILKDLKELDQLQWKSVWNFAQRNKNHMDAIVEIIQDNKVYSVRDWLDILQTCQQTAQYEGNNGISAWYQLLKKLSKQEGQKQLSQVEQRKDNKENTSESSPPSQNTNLQALQDQCDLHIKNMTLLAGLSASCGVSCSAFINVIGQTATKVLQFVLLLLFITLVGGVMFKNRTLTTIKADKRERDKKTSESQKKKGKE